MKIIMVHGSWHWGACFQKVSDRLAEAGHAVATPDLISHGYDATAYGAVASLADYIEPVAKMVRESKEPLALVGHSMGGVTLTALGEMYPDKISKLIYLTAFMAPKGACANDYIIPNERVGVATELFEVVSIIEDGRAARLDLANLAGVKAAFYGDCTDHDIGVAAKNALPVNTTIPNVAVSAITPERFGRIPRVYVECTLDKAIPIATQRLMTADVPGAEIVTMEASHSPFFSKPAEVASILLRALG